MGVDPKQKTLYHVGEESKARKVLWTFEARINGKA